MNKKLFACLMALTAVFLFSCRSTDEVSNETDFLEYINGYSSGSLSKYSTIKISLSNPSPAFDNEKKDELLKDIFEFSPNIKGEAHWIDKNTIEFRPSETMKNGEEYHATFHLSEILKVEKEEQKDFIFKFKTIKQRMSFESSHPIYSDKGTVEIKGRLLLTDKEDEEKIKKTLSAELGGKDINIQWGTLSELESGYQYTFKVADIASSENKEQGKE